MSQHWIYVPPLLRRPISIGLRVSLIFFYLIIVELRPRINYNKINFDGNSSVYGRHNAAYIIRHYNVLTNPIDPLKCVNKSDRSVISVTVGYSLDIHSAFFVVCFFMCDNTVINAFVQAYHL